MSCTFEKILIDVKSLSLRLRGREEVADKITRATGQVQLKLRSMNELQDKLTTLTKNSSLYENDGPLVFEGKMEDCSLERLRMENIELRGLLQEYQTALELIMTRYRADMNDFMDYNEDEDQSSHMHKESCENSAHEDLEKDLTLKYVQLYKAAIDSNSTSEVNVQRLEKTIETLYSENEMMREVLGLGEQHFHQLESSSTSLRNHFNSGKNTTTSYNHISSEDCKFSDHFLDTSFSDDDRCSVSSDASSVKTLV